MITSCASVVMAEDTGYTLWWEKTQGGDAGELQGLADVSASQSYWQLIRLTANKISMAVGDLHINPLAHFMPGTIATAGNSSSFGALDERNQPNSTQCCSRI